MIYRDIVVEEIISEQFMSYCWFMEAIGLQLGLIDVGIVF
jgi:hypothetical protein